MPNKEHERHISIDARTNREISRGIGDALRRSMGPSHHSDRLQILLDAFKAQDEQIAGKRKGD